MALVLVGQSELWEDKLRLKRYDAVRQRIDINCVLPLEKVFSVEEQIIYLFSVYVNIAITLHFTSLIV